MRSWMAFAVAAAMVAGGCSDAGHASSEGDAGPARARPAAAAKAPAPPPPPPMTAADTAAARARIAARGDSVRAAFERARPLTAREVAMLRQDVNAGQIATARSLGIQPSTTAGIEQLERAGRLVALGDSTVGWVLRDMDHSVPFVVPDARAMLDELGRRFQARLARLGLPAYRMKVTSALRTDESQAELRKINSYASRIVSAHEFGTTIDVSHERFAVPAAIGGRAPELEAEMLEEVGKAHAKVLQAELGRAILEMRGEHALHVMMENMQPVYHMTVARHFTR
ncbi:DUF5715 family protein [Longimicrobium sp.]|uniref:DUF5715 family protein n=1 Tax=Longimicrobium sp. TaxID=2029185 RepID=UPI002CD51A7E|nr:DUF5715 family protein [Longimicrobium sp.]HSU16089.1 DUF5715 family protein [Longimicrobium sp.]